MLFLKNIKKKSQKITIQILQNRVQYDIIESTNTSLLEMRKYTSNQCNFTIYAFENIEHEKEIKIYYCADEIQVHEVGIPSHGFQYTFAITSNFFNEYSNIERTKLNLPSSETLKQQNLEESRPEYDYEKYLQKICIDIINKHNPDFKKKNKEKLQELEQTYGYIDFNKIDPDQEIIDEKKIINDYRDAVHRKENLLADLLKNDTTDLEVLVQAVSEQNKIELAQYIFHRNIIIKK